jgi:hypothetical protein
MSRDRRFFDPIELAGRKPLVTLRDAAQYITKLPNDLSDVEEWQAAMQALMLVAEQDGPTMSARIGVMWAINRHIERVFDPSRKGEASGMAGHATRCPNTGAGRRVEISEIPELPCRGQLNLSEPVNHTATCRC